MIWVLGLFVWCVASVCVFVYQLGHNSKIPKYKKRTPFIVVFYVLEGVVYIPVLLAATLIGYLGRKHE